MKKSQSSLEFLIIFGIGFGIILILTGIFLTYSSEAKDNLDQSQLNKIGSEIVTNIEQIYFLGIGNKITIKTKFPQKIQNLSIHHENNSGELYDYLNITHISNGIIANSIYYPNELYIRFNCTNCNHYNNISYFNQTILSEGPKQIKIESKGEYVEMSFVQ